jgi:hypothetical protein
VRFLPKLASQEDEPGEAKTSRGKLTLLIRIQTGEKGRSAGLETARKGTTMSGGDEPIWTQPRQGVLFYKQISFV